MATAFFKFCGHGPTSQTLRSEGEDADLPHIGMGAWPKGEVREATDDQARYLRAFNSRTQVVFEEVPNPTKTAKAADKESN